MRISLALALGPLLQYMPIEDEHRVLLSCYALDNALIQETVQLMLRL